jgi:hypothetical protein
VDTSQETPSYVKVLFRYFPGGFEETHNLLVQNSELPYEDLNPGALEYETGALITRLRRTVILKVIPTSVRNSQTFLPFSNSKFRVLCYLDLQQDTSLSLIQVRRMQ